MPYENETKEKGYRLENWGIWRMKISESLLFKRTIFIDKNKI